MYIEQKKFNDEETLLEQLFDLSIGNPSTYMIELGSRLKDVLYSHPPFLEEMKSINDEEEKMEYEDDMLRGMLAKYLLEHFTAFEVRGKQLLAINNAEEQLLYDLSHFS